MKKNFWVLGVSVVGKKKPQVKILSSAHVPIKGERLTILLSQPMKEVLVCVREMMGDEEILATWKRGGVIRLF